VFENDIKDSGMDFQKGKVDTSDAWSRREEASPEGKPKAKHALDSEKMTRVHGRVLSRYVAELDRQAENRADMAIDEDFYDNIQWTEEDAAVLRERGQMPLVYNVISSSVNWVIGTEKRGRTDYKVLPRRKDAGKPAERKSQLLKYLSDVNRTPFHRSRAFEDCVKVGLGWVEDGVQDDDDGEPVFTRYESWRNILWDSACTEKDLSDCRYIYRTKWVDLDIAEAMFPDRVGLLRESCTDGDRYGLDDEGDDAMDSHEMEREQFSSSRSVNGASRRDRVRLIECWFREPKKVTRISGGDFAGEVVEDKASLAPGHKEELASGRAVLVERTMMRMHVAIFTSQGMLYYGESPYRHNQFPFTPMWCYRRGRDGLPYGMIRGMRDIQQDINKRASKALHILSTNKTVMDEGAVDDLEEFREEVSRPDAIIVKKSGKELVINAERELAPAHLDLMSRSIMMIQTQSGVTDENMGRSTNATSGRAITARQEQGSLATAGIFDNLRFAVQVQGEKQLSLLEQYFSDEKEFRITNMRGTPEYITINDGLPENDIVRTKADFVISETDWRATVRQAQTEELMALLGQLAPVAPQVAIVMLDLIVEGMDIASRDELVKRIRQVTGMRDPDAEELTPEEQQAEAAKQQAEQAQAELQQRAAMADIGKKEADAARSQAAAQKDVAGVAKIQSDIALQGIQSQLQALQAAIAALTTPQAVSAADTILHEAGFQSRTEQEMDAAEQARQAQAEQQQVAAQQQQAEQAHAQQQEQPVQADPQQQPMQ